MKNFSPEVKNAILLEYIPRSSTHSFAALADRHGVLGGESTIRGWFNRWNGTMQSLRPRSKSGRPSILTPNEVEEHIRAPLEAKNKAHEPVHYTDVARDLRRKIRRPISLRTVQRIGKATLKATHKRTRRVMEDECQSEAAHAQAI